MRVIPCYNPKSVFNKYLGAYTFARCGKCYACLDARAATWVARLDAESSCHRYVFFGTFQYDETHVNQFVRLKDCDSPDSKDIYYIDSLTGQVINLFYDGCVPTQSDIDYCRNTKILLVPSVRDFQLFLKSLRKYIKQHYPNANIRYFNTFEIGPSTFRPHTHCLFFLDSPLLAQDFAKLCARFWKYGNCFDVHPVDGSASSYVASYVNSLTHLPAIYLHPQVRPKSTFSKVPPIGFSVLTGTDMREYIVNKTFQFTLFSASHSTFVDVPLWRSFESRLYPRLSRFSLLTYRERVLLYGLSENLPFIDDVCISDIHIARFYAFYLRSTCPSWFQRYFDMACQIDGHFNPDSLYKFVLTLINFHRNKIVCGFTTKEYVTYITDYYDDKESRQFKEFLLTQDSYFQEHSRKDYLLFFPNFYKQVNGKRFGTLKDWQKFYLTEYGYNFTDSDIVTLRYTSTTAYRELKGLHDKIFHQNTKTKVNNDYLLAHKDQFGNVISYYESLQ